MASRSSGRRRRDGRTGSDLVLPIPAGAGADAATSGRVASFSSIVVTCFAADIHDLLTALLAAVAPVVACESFRTPRTNWLRFLLGLELAEWHLNKRGRADSSRPRPFRWPLGTHSW